MKYSPYTIRKDGQNMSEKELGEARNQFFDSLLKSNGEIKRRQDWVDITGDCGFETLLELECEKNQALRDAIRYIDEVLLGLIVI